VPSPSPSPAQLAPPSQRVHVVEGGDTLNRIAQRYGVTVEGIMQANGFTDRNRILRIGERLTIPDAPSASPVPR
jgi:LysM repeat protein